MKQIHLQTQAGMFGGMFGGGLEGITGMAKLRALLWLSAPTVTLGLTLLIVGKNTPVSAKGRFSPGGLPPVNIASPQVPTDVNITGLGVPTRFFDDFSWRSFIALVWPAVPGFRGVPDTTKPLNAPGSRVFETYKENWEVFHGDGTAPAPWLVYDQAQYNPAKQTPVFGDITLASFTKFGAIGEAGFGNLVGRLVAQNQTYTRYLTGMNETEFNAIRQHKWYLRANLPKKSSDPPLTFPNGSLDVKSAWIEMAGIQHPGRYYTRKAWVQDPATGKSALKLVGLVGLHIVQKTPSRPQWIWSSFEQVDNVPPAQPGSGSFAFNNGTGAPMPTDNPYGLDTASLAQHPLAPVPPPFNVTRPVPIDAASTQQTNALYRNALKQQNSVWQFYQLVLTQWPKKINTPASTETFTGSNNLSCLANTTMETFDANCMGCHGVTRHDTDFLWSLKDHAWSPILLKQIVPKDPVLLNLLKRLKTDAKARKGQ